MPPKKTESEALPVVQETVVKYVGLSDIRIIRKEDWASIDIDHEEVVWDRSNHFTVRASDLSEQALGYCKADSELIVTSV